MLKTKICYLCGSSGANSVDHIPPKAIFLTKTTDLITVPAHVECNKRWELDDEYFRLALINMAYPYSSDARTIFSNKLAKFHSPQKTGFKKSILNDLRELDVYTPAGLYLGKQSTLGITANRILPVIQRIAKGLYYLRHKSSFPQDVPMQASLMDRNMTTDRKKLEAKGLFKSVGNGNFKYLYKHTTEDHRYGFFWFAFYDCVDFTVFATDKPSVIPPSNYTNLYI